MSRVPGRSRWSAILIAIGLAASGGRAEELRFERLSLEQGLSQSSANTIVQDSLGFLWIGTQDGLNRYDGYSFKVYRHDPDDPASLGNSFVWVLHLDRRGDLWAGTEGGLEKLDREANAFRHYRHDPARPESLTHNSVRALWEDLDGYLWIGTRGGGLDRFDPRTKTFRHFRHDAGRPDSLAHDDVRALWGDAAGTLWVGTYGGGLDRLDRGEDRFVHHRQDPRDPSSLRDDRILALLGEGSGTLWIGTVDGLDRFDRALGDVLHPRSLAHVEVASLYEDGAGRFWVGTDGGGLHLLDRESASFTRYRRRAYDPSSLSSDFVRALYEDRSGIFWVGTDGGGLNKLDPSKNVFAHYRHDPLESDGLSHDLVFAILEDRLGKLWVGTWGGLDVLDRETGQVRHWRHDPNDSDSLTSDEVWRLCEDGSGNLWVGTSGGLDRFDRERGRFLHHVHDPADPDSLASNNVRALLADRAGRLWIGTDRGLDRYEAARGRFEHFRHSDDPHSLAADAVWVLHEDRSGNLWIGTVTAGLDRLGLSGRFDHYRHDPDDARSLSNDYVRSIHEDREGILWIGTDDGFNRFDPATGRFRRYDERDGLPNSVIYTVVEEGSKALWLSTNRGLARFDPETETFQAYDVRDGLQSNEFNTGAAFNNRRGELFFGGVNGLNVFHPGDLETNPHVPPVRLTSFQVFHREVDLGPDLAEVDSIELSHRDYRFSLEFAALDFRSPEKNRYAYKLEGLDDDWIDHGNDRRITFTTLDPGEYVLRVRGSNNDGVWNEEGRSLRITILPPAWKSAWAVAVYALAAIIAILGALYFERQRRERRRALRRAQEEAAASAAADRAKTEFLAKMSHEIRTPMGGIIGMTELISRRELPEEVRRQVEIVRSSAETLLRVIDDILDFSKVEAGKMELEEVDFSLREVLERVYGLLSPRAGEKGVGCELVVGEAVPDVVRGDPTRVSQVLMNLVSNAIKFTPEGEVTVRADLAERRGERIHVRVLVRDTGIGVAAEDHAKLFDPFTQADTSMSRRFGGTGLGLAISKRLIEEMGGTIDFRSSPSGGSTFECHFLFQDASGAAAGDPEAAPRAPHPSFDGRRVLLAEDEPTNRMVALKLLRDLGCRVDVAENGRRVLELFRPGSYDLVLMDCQMPELDGYEATRRLRRKERYGPPTPIVAVTAHAMPGAREKCLAAGMDDYISKPYRAHELSAVLERWLERGPEDPC